MIQRKWEVIIEDLDNNRIDIELPRNLFWTHNGAVDYAFGYNNHQLRNFTKAVVIKKEEYIK